MKGKSTTLALICGFVFAIGCATGSEDIGAGDDGLEPDAMGNPHVVIDAAPLPIDANPLPIDANIPIDASIPIDAPTGGTGACTSSSECSGDTPCCLVGFDQCFPDPGNPFFCM